MEHEGSIRSFLLLITGVGNRRGAIQAQSTIYSHSYYMQFSLGHNHAPEQFPSYTHAVSGSLFVARSCFI